MVNGRNPHSTLTHSEKVSKDEILVRFIQVYETEGYFLNPGTETLDTKTSSILY